MRALLGLECVFDFHGFLVVRGFQLGHVSLAEDVLCAVVLAHPAEGLQSQLQSAGVALEATLVVDLANVDLLHRVHLLRRCAVMLCSS